MIGNLNDDRQVSAECGQPFPDGYKPYTLTGDFQPGDIEPDTKGRSQLNLYFCAPYGNYEIDIEVYGDFARQDGKRIGWEIEDGQTQVFCGVCTDRTYNCLTIVLFTLAA